MSRNRLDAASSAYLQSAAHQPIHWHSWSGDAFDAAREGNRPILLDIGAAWCHWCHVMDRESYEDATLADFLNQHFICIKVDRDERPDVDARYQRAVQAFSGQGGWPLTAFLTPDGEVFYGGTYFPPDGKYGRPGFRSVLERVLEVYRTSGAEVLDQASTLRRLVEEHLDETQAGDVSPSILDDAVAQIDRSFDPQYGGFGREPKFPHPSAIRLLLARWYETGASRTREIVETTLTRMARGGVYDQLGGGFHRYSVDRRWIVPHFEKMAYDNAEMLRAYVEAYLAFGTEEYADAVRGIVRWVRDVASDPEGGYAASQDADVGLDDDGDYFTWTRAEAAAVLTSDELDVAAAYYDIGTAGEMQHNPDKNVLFAALPIGKVALAQTRTAEAAARLLKTAQEKLLQARNQRPAPFVDHTRYTNWNAMMAGAMLQAGAVVDDRWAREHAMKTLARIRSENPASDTVSHRPGGDEQFLDDQVQVANAALDAFEVTGHHQWLDWAEAVMDRVWREYWDQTGGGLFDVAATVEGEGLLPARAKSIQDTPTPSPNGMASIVWARLYELTDQDRHRDRRDAVLRAFAGTAAGLGIHGSTYFLAVDRVLNPTTHLIVVGPENNETADRMLASALRAPVPRRTVQRVSPGGPSRPLPAPIAAMAGNLATTCAYACRATHCLPPATTVEDWEETIARLTREARQ
ncbi:MAG: thioredoxin domain-containing protein [Gemmatimonadales bacterium]|nr:thioredoxin domain-containing protein [Gemmatimonadales bacterium]